MSRGISEKVSYDLLIKSFLVNGCERKEIIETLEKEIDKIWGGIWIEKTFQH